MIVACPKCGSHNLRASHRRSLWERLLSLLGFCAIRCKDCGNRFQEEIVILPGIGYARCPKCMRTDLTDWEEKYYYPPRYQQWLLHFGAKAHRCGPCRHNFVSFRPRKREYVPSWKQRPSSGQAGGETATGRTPVSTRVA